MALEAQKMKNIYNIMIITTDRSGSGRVCRSTAVYCVFYKYSFTLYEYSLSYLNIH